MQSCFFNWSTHYLIQNAPRNASHLRTAHPKAHELSTAPTTIPLARWLKKNKQQTTKQIKLIKTKNWVLPFSHSEAIAQEGVSAAPLTAGIHSQQAIHLLFNTTAFPIYFLGRAHGSCNGPAKLTSQVQVELLIQDASVQGSAGLGQPPGFQFCWTLPGEQAGWCTARSLSRPGPWVCGSQGQELTRSPSCSARGAASSQHHWATSGAASSVCSGNRPEMLVSGLAAAQPGCSWHNKKILRQDLGITQPQ